MLKPTTGFGDPLVLTANADREQEEIGPPSRWQVRTVINEPRDDDIRINIDPGSTKVSHDRVASCVGRIGLRHSLATDGQDEKEVKTITTCM